MYVNKTDKLDNLFADRGKLGLIGPPAPIMVFNKTSNYVKFTVPLGDCLEKQSDL